MSLFRLDYDKDYGIDHRSGWSVAYDGSYLVQFERFLVVALVKATWKVFRAYGAREDI